MESNPPNCDRIEGEPKNAQNENNAPNEKSTTATIILAKLLKIRGTEIVLKNISKQTKLDYWLSVNNNNQFSALQTESDCESNGNNADEIDVKPPPIFVDRVENIQPLVQMLNDCSNNSYELKILNLNRVKIQATTSDSFSTIIRQLDEKNTEFHTQHKNDRNFKVILKNMHPSFDTGEISMALLEYRHVVTNIWNVKQRPTQKPLPLFVVEIDPKPTNKNIYSITNLLHSRVAFEPPRPKR